MLLARDGSLYVAWFSDRGNNPDIYIRRTTDGTDWTPPIRVTTDTDGDFNPSLIQDSAGVFHLAWFRWDAPFRGHIVSNSSADGVTWSPANELLVTTTPSVDDWVPTLVEGVGGTLLVYFVSDARDPAVHNTEIYLASRHPGDPAWSAAAPVTTVNSATQNDHLPFAARIGAQVALAWVRYDSTTVLPWDSPKSDVWYATTTDGLTFSTPTRVTTDAGNVVNLFPQLYHLQSGALERLWLSTRSGSPEPLEDAANGTGGVLNAMLGAGYSHRIAPTPTAGVYLGVWVAGPEGSQDLYYRFFRR